MLRAVAKRGVFLPVAASAAGVSALALYSSDSRTTALAESAATTTALDSLWENDMLEVVAIAPSEPSLNEETVAAACALEACVAVSVRVRVLSVRLWCQSR